MLVNNTPWTQIEWKQALLWFYSSYLLKLILAKCMKICLKTWYWKTMHVDHWLSPNNGRLKTLNQNWELWIPSNIILMTANNFFFLSLDYIINHINLSVIIFQYSTKLFKLLQHFLQIIDHIYFFLNWTIQVYSGSNQWNTFMIILVRRCNLKFLTFKKMSKLKIN